MSKYNKAQINFILSRLRDARGYYYDIKDQLRKKYIPKKPAAVTKYEGERTKANERAEKEADEIIRRQNEYIASVEASLILSDTDFDLESALKEFKAIAGAK